MDFEGFRAWLDAYVRGCETNDPEDVTRLFAEDAEYYPGPFDEPYRGNESIAEHWADDPWTVGPRFDARVDPLFSMTVWAWPNGGHPIRRLHRTPPGSTVPSSSSGSTIGDDAPSTGNGAWPTFDSSEKLRRPVVLAPRRVGETSVGFSGDRSGQDG